VIRKLLISMGSSVVCGAVVLAATMTKGMAIDITTFSFTNNSGNTSGTVTGVIYGLTPNETNGTPTDVEITSYPTAINNGAYKSLPAASEDTPWDIFNAQSYTTVGDAVTTDASGNITSGYIFIDSGQSTYFYLSATSSHLQVQTAGPYNSVIASATSIDPQVVPWSDPSGGSLPAIGAVLGIGVMRKAKQFQKAKVGSSQLEKV